VSKRAKSALFPLFRRHFSYAIFRLTHTYIGTYTHGVNVSQCVCFICISVFDFCRRWRLFNLTCRSVAQQQPPNEINKSAPPFGSNLSLCSRKGLPFARFFCSTFPHFPLSRAVPRPQTCG